ncbi:molybdopterin-synthase adenylyltransferase MoeB [Xanthomonas rydalmerensis]|uniref:Molybdopterin-synthase adenylyltransferase MoeB n=1 Tax=Xanthomonas rydalmerensis TaxID=3046274 RepID=A0ABZ0JS79_9XANT|nr:molybdopterin-synthase adenylyltransferase MoeB [Xanthomonas sp. DM-2023]WOS42679.1 molybdopterin-synthase adenylyltransferase MoeB [Xanthomonas sp. DM-2023]WOS46865.1 molybdopterin-synthase adenylyltransferase MoeB [Xanthomonas sp. DM-2023]WOS51044.1 molybdopterin-synthase adenylyltransferase MoeB [Xanthomonas sp. DM-2023]WOS55225.1 molybdopterin-synthase adenylyltransferase MoeB [Xanthomonas sp. DM-2023]WOS59407.1 molybdopterin-synthase adenylyltransferase MoeB [Xanthomonas sp. DM-2023]
MGIRELTPAQAQARQAQGAHLIDIREEHERATGMASGAQGVARAQLQADPSAYLGAKTEVLLICQSGKRSHDTAVFLEQAGYTQVASVLGGTTRWQREGLPLQRPALAPEQEDFFDRYSRHLRLPEVGVEGQRRLQAARVLLVGAGGLGSPAGFYLAAAGVGQLRIADDDVVERSNLQRQILHGDARIGQAKVDSAAASLGALNPGVRVEALRERVTADNVERLLQDVDVVLDGSDNFPARYLLNDACVKLGKPLVYGAVQRFEGQVSVFDAGRRRGQAPCYRCLFPEPPPPEFAPNCADAGVLGVLPGIVGLLQANEVLKLLLNIGEPLRGRLLHFDALAMRFRETRLSADPQCPLCAPERPFPGYIDYAQFCGAEG